MSSLSDTLKPIKDALPEEARDLKLDLGAVIERCSFDPAEAVSATLVAAIMSRSIDKSKYKLSAFSLLDFSTSRLDLMVN